MRAIARITALTALGMVVAFSAAGCAAGTTSPPGATTPTSPVTSTQPPATATPTTATPSATVPSWPATPRSGSGSGSEGFLTAVRTGLHAGYDRVVFQFNGGIPGYHAEYVAQVRQDPSDKLVPLAGQAFLRLVFRPATAYQSYQGPATLHPDLPTLLQVSAAGDFEGYLSFGLGLSERAGFTIFTLTDPSRVVLDLAHPSS